MTSTFFSRALVLVALLTATALPGCAGGEQEDEEALAEGEGDEPEGELAQDLDEAGAVASALSSTCRRNGEKGKRYVFDDGKEVVCWIRAYGPAGATDNLYYVLNATGRARRVKVALDNMPDTHCQRIGAARQYVFHVAGVRFAGKPQHVRGC